MSKFLQKTDETVLNPFAFMRRMTGDFDRAFGNHFGLTALPEIAARLWSPPIEVGERDNKFYVRVDLPGLTKQDVKVRVAHDELTIEGERRAETQDTEAGVYRSERTYGQFFRRIGIPDHVKAEEAVASFKNGVLEIAMPAIQVPETKVRTLEIDG